MSKSILLVDLNNFSRYPSMAIGYLAAAMRQASFGVSVFAPLMLGVHGTTRERRPHAIGLSIAKLNHLAATSSRPGVRKWRDWLAKRRASGITAHHRQVVQGFIDRVSSEKPDAVLISTYLMYREVCVDLCRVCSEAGIPALIGGPYFAQREVVSNWVAIPGLTALVAGEVELKLASILNSLLGGGEIERHPGVFVSGDAGHLRGQIAPPLTDLDAVPFPDYSDFPWEAYPNRIVPLLTGRGCAWGACSFCSDVTSTAGRTFRSRSYDAVLREVSHHHRRHGASLFVFTDLKLNSETRMWRALIAGMQAAAPGAHWIGAVHVGSEEDNGLSDLDLREAARSGCVRLTTGLESGSQRVSDLMKKGTRLENISSFLKSASSAGISCRCTMILGYPGEGAEDVHASAEFLARHSREIERVSLNRLQIVTGTVLHRSLKRPDRFNDIRIVGDDHAMARVDHQNDTARTRGHRRAVMRLLGEVHRINRRELSVAAREFEGVM